ncbi:MAG: cupin domain-containing protein [Rhodospirillales bacterium]|jgi:mannose-6-phosphate isomerase-like protein (cupin superfamily)|nr:cupin domain-containing protein [Rhodospirillales bacterium]|tara:strand:- start:25 stop:540 length:516 start_codon:yes stop_codon:yes gene_type:complete
MGIRRVVTGHDESGKAVVIYDGDAPNVKRPTSEIESTLFWVTDKSPADNSGDEDTGNRDVGIAPGPGGAIFRVVEFGPEGGAASEDELEYLSKVGGAERPEGARHPGMHKTNSIDYAIIMSGEIDMLLDGSEVHVKAGDVIVQRGTVHAWANRGSEPCKIAFILIDADPVP